MSSCRRVCKNVSLFDRIPARITHVAVGLVGITLATSTGCLNINLDWKAQWKGDVKPGINDAYKNANVDDWIARFESESREIFEYRRKIVAEVAPRPGEVIADIGAGTGFFTVLFADAVLPGGSVYAVDITPEFLEHIKKRTARAGLKNVTTVRCKDDSVELDKSSIDLAFICDVYHHFEHPRSTMKSIYRALRPGGELIVIDFERIEGKSRDWIIDHVRAGREKVIKEIVKRGFELVDSSDDGSYLTENYFLRFRKPD